MFNEYNETVAWACPLNDIYILVKVAVEHWMWSPLIVKMCLREASFLQYTSFSANSCTKGLFSLRRNKAIDPILTRTVTKFLQVVRGLA